MRSVVAGDEQRVSELLAAGAAPCSVSGDAYTALHYAALTGRTEIAKLLCAAPGGAASLALCDKYGNTPLSLAVWQGGGSEGLVAALLEADASGATFDTQNMRGSTALACASENGYEGAVRLLLAHGARQELQNEDGHSALHLAAIKSHVGVAKLLCAAPGAAAALALRNKIGDTPLALAVVDGGGNEALLAALLEADASGVTFDAQNTRGESALSWASYKGCEGAVRLLLARGARQELQNEYGSTALHNAARKGHVGIAKLLCAAPGATAALALRTKDGNATPLLLATSLGGGCEGLVAALLEADAAGMTVNVQDKFGGSALMWASKEGYEGAVRLLLARGARQELQNEDGHSALHLAAIKSHVGVVKLLCAAPGAAAALALRNKIGDTPLDACCRGRWW